MKHCAKFEKVSFDQFASDYLKYNELDNIEIIKKYYDDIILPVRKTVGSAGYDFFAPFAFALKEGESLIIPTGIRCKIDPGWVLKIYPRSSLGFNYHIGLDNTVGIIDSDYYGAENEGHIMIKISSPEKHAEPFVISKGKGFVQGIFLEYGITYDDEVEDLRVGGIGSTK